MFSEDITEFFDTNELAEAATLNGGSVIVVVEDEGVDDEGVDAPRVGRYDFKDICFKAVDYTTVTNASDTLVLRGETWRYPLLKKEDSATKTVRFRKSERPNLRRR